MSVLARFPPAILTPIYPVVGNVSPCDHRDAAFSIQSNKIPRNQSFTTGSLQPLLFYDYCPCLRRSRRYVAFMGWIFFTYYYITCCNKCAFIIISKLAIVWLMTLFTKFERHWLWRHHNKGILTTLLAFCEANPPITSGIILHSAGDAKLCWFLCC